MSSAPNHTFHSASTSYCSAGGGYRPRRLGIRGTDLRHAAALVPPIAGEAETAAAAGMPCPLRAAYALANVGVVLEAASREQHSFVHPDDVLASAPWRA